MYLKKSCRQIIGHIIQLIVNYKSRSLLGHVSIRLSPFCRFWTILVLRLDYSERIHEAHIDHVGMVCNLPLESISFTCAIRVLRNIVISHKIYSTCRVNSLWTSYAIWRYRSGSTLAQLISCCLAAPNHKLNHVAYRQSSPVAFTCSWI